MRDSVDFSAPGAAEQLVGWKLLDQWQVIQRIRHDDGFSGSTRSACYKAVSPNGNPAFVKAFDFRRQELQGDTDFLEKMVREFNYERNVHIFCRDEGLSRVTRIYGADQIVINGEVVHFLVCEWADLSLREHQPPGDKSVSLHDRFIALRDSAAALTQLHNAGIAHQDIKPSNAVCYKTGGLKLTDLGSSSCEKLESAPHDSQAIVGQPNYAPYEQLYDHPTNSWKQRRFGCDLFLLGNLCFTSLIGGSLSYLALHTIPEKFRHTAFTGNYSEVLPHLIEAHETLLPALLEEIVPESIKKEVSDLIKCLCHPDPAKRGHAKNIINNRHQFGLERVISHFDHLATKSKFLSRVQ